LTGHVIYYWQIDYPITVAIRPSISLNTAMNNAMNGVVSQGRMGHLKLLAVTDPDHDGKERLVFLVTFTGSGTPYIDGSSMDDTFVMGHEIYKPLPWWYRLQAERNTYLGAVDAHTGEFLGWNFEIIPPPKPGELR